MIKNYFITAWRNLVKSKFYTGISILGLTIGLTIGIFILIWVQEELSYNQFSETSAQIYRVNSNVGTGNTRQTWASSPGPVAAFATTEIPGVVNAVRVTKNWNYSIFSYDQSVFEVQNTAFVDPEFFRMFDLDMIYGNQEKPFLNGNSVVLSASTAKKYFGNENPIGKTIQGDYTDNYTVVGVVEDLPANSSVDFEMFFPLSIFAKAYEGLDFTMDSDWGNFNFATYLELSPETSAEKVVSQLSEINRKHDPNAKPNEPGEAYNLQLISNLNLYHPDGSPAGIQTVRIFIIVAILILLIASINYINLSTARSIQRAKEVSIRKIIGADKKHLFGQFIIESILFFSITLVLSIGLIYLLNPYFNELSGKQVQISLLDIGLWKLILLVFCSTLIASSIYPALLLTSFKPLQAVKGKVLPEIGTASFRKVLVTVQFVFSVILIIGTLVIGRQLEYLQTKDPGYDRSQVITLNMREEMRKHGTAIKTEIKNLSGVESVAVANHTLVNTAGRTTASVSWKTKNPQNTFIITPLGVDEEFIPLMEMDLVTGENFNGTKADSTHFILNETAVELTGIKNPIGKRFSLWETEGTIIGVVKDFNFSSMKNEITPSVMYYNPNGYKLYIKSTGNQVSNTISSLGEIWKEYSSGFPFQYSFLDEDYERMYRSDERTGKLFNIFSIIAIFVSCLGLFGLATYTAQLKTKEIGIRKVLGASIFQITHLLSKDFLKLVFISTIIAAPLAWFLMHRWLQDFAYKTNLSWWIFALAGFIALFIALITVSFQAVKAAIANPVNSLRSE